MEILHTIIELVNANFIRAMFVSILVILPFKYFLKTKIDTYYALQIIRWIIVSYTLLVLIRFLITLLFPAQNESMITFTNRAFGPYWWAYWIMFLGHCILPLILFIEKAGKNIYLLLFIAFAMNTGWWIESFVIYLTSFHRDFIKSEWSHDSDALISNEMILFIQGICVGLLILLIGNIIKKTSTPNSYAS